MKSILQELGLTEVESRVYLALLKSGSSLAGKISRDTGIHRRTVYDAIERLVEKGLVSYIRTNNRKYFEAVHPRRLLEIVKERESSITNLLPELEAQFSVSKEKKETVFFRGKRALQTIFNGQFNHPGIVYYGGQAKILSEIFKLYVRKFDSTRKERKIDVRILTDIAGREMKDVQNLYSSQVRFIKNWKDNKTMISIYGDRVVIITWSEDPIAIMIKEKEIADGFINYFNIMWSKASK